MDGSKVTESLCVPNSSSFSATMCHTTHERLEYNKWRSEGRGVQLPPPQKKKNSEGPPKSCQTQPDCENC